MMVKIGWYLKDHRMVKIWRRGGPLCHNRWRWIAAHEHHGHHDDILYDEHDHYAMITCEWWRRQPLLVNQWDMMMVLFWWCSYVMVLMLSMILVSPPHPEPIWFSLRWWCHVPPLLHHPRSLIRSRTNLQSFQSPAATPVLLLLVTNHHAGDNLASAYRSDDNSCQILSNNQN